MPSIEQSSSEELELYGAVSSWQSGKSPGPDGYPVEFYKVFWQKLSPLLLDMFNESLEKGHLPQTLNQASISVLLKDCTSFHPKSLLNVDFKLLSKLLTLRLKKFFRLLFHKTKLITYSLRQLYNTIYNTSQVNTEEALISLDAEKAFDRVESSYLFYTLDKFGFGKKFISWIKLH